MPYPVERAIDDAHRQASKPEVKLDPDAHSDLVRAVWNIFGPQFFPGSELIHAGVTGKKQGYFDNARLASLGVTIDNHSITSEIEKWTKVARDAHIRAQ